MKALDIVILGSGNLAQQLLSAFAKNKASNVLQIYSRNESEGHELAKSFGIDYTPFVDEIKNADLYLLAVSDNAIAQVSHQLMFKDRLVAHCSGSTPMEVLAPGNRKGVFYPLQTFTKGVSMDFKNIPMCLESESAGDYLILEFAAKCISDKVLAIDSNKRSKLHLIAVFVNNFTNHMFSIGNRLSNEFELDFDIFHPLIEQTANKIKSVEPLYAQTGPAARGDINTMEKHYSLITDDQIKKLYSSISNSILNFESEKF